MSLATEPDDLCSLFVRGYLEFGTRLEMVQVLVNCILAVVCARSCETRGGKVARWH